MSRITYIEKRFSKKSMDLIIIANGIIEEYQEQGYDLTVRQLYYQMVAKDFIENSERSYRRMSSIISDARMNGLVDWTAIVDRTRNIRYNSHFNSPEDIISVCGDQFMLDHWKDQKYRPEVWIEKDALIGVISDICSKLDVPYFSCRGYNSQSEMWSSGQRMIRNIKNGHVPFIIHLGDHDPSGIDMTRDIIERLELFTHGEKGVDFKLSRIALNYDQILKYNPPPNPAKPSDSRIENYITQYGGNSWELDALKPAVIEKLIEDQINEVIDWGNWNKTNLSEEQDKELLGLISNNWNKVENYLKNEDT
jgi:hypothetical protein|tara:strand:+ start:1090 stop:2013 length:924 start_codon:yes stop_codon:yes gene_type:complete